METHFRIFCERKENVQAAMRVTLCSTFNFRSDKRRLDERQGRYSTKQKGSLRKVEAEEDCICEAPLKDTFLSQYQEAYQETTTSLAKFEIVDVTELDLHK
jgi:hypothetical protein